MKKKLLLSLLSLTALLVLSACGSSGTKTTTKIVAGGSTALQPLVTQGAQEFMTENPEVSITVQPGGSGAGLTSVSNGSFQIGNSDIFAEEKSGIDASKLKDHQVAVVGVAPIVNSEITKKVKLLTQEELIDIFSGKITNWKKVGGPDEEITIIGRTEGSGTRALFDRYGLNKGTELASAATQDSTGAAAKAVASTPGSISYVSFAGAVLEGVSKMPIQFIGEESATQAIDKNVMDNSWKIWGYEHMYTAADPDETTVAFIDYVKSNKTNLHGLGFISTEDMKGERTVDGTWTEK
ncbi:MAG: phosphate ABC transporter substrate-binding protein [Lactovum sp.]